MSRQWTILREVERARAGGVAIDELTALCHVTTRTIRRDLQALEEAGFPLFDDRSGDDGKTRWRVNGQAFKGLGAGLTLSELSALYFSRTLLASLTGAAFRDEVASAFEKLASVLTPHMRQFLDQMPRVITTKKETGRISDAQQGNVGRAVEATLLHRQAEITYDSKSSGRTKTYIVHPYRLAYAQGGLYLLAYVPEYKEIRTFAVERLQRVSLLEDRFEPIEELPEDAFPHSLGVHSGPPARVEIDFLPTVADYVLGRSWHPSQATTEQRDGGVRMVLDVCLDRALTSWILSFGPLARVVSPEALAREIAAQLSDASGLYAPASGTA